jgi:hypothetical protein
MTRILAALVIVVTMTGCAYLQIDTKERLWGVTLAPKIVGRILWAVPSLGVSELVYACARERGGGPRNFDICSYGDGGAYRDRGYAARHSQVPPAAPEHHPDQDLADDGIQQTQTAQQQPELNGDGETQPHYPAAIPD